MDQTVGGASDAKSMPDSTGPSEEPFLDGFDTEYNRFRHRIAIVNTPIISEGAPRARGRAPRLGESTPALLTELLYDQTQISDLLRDGVIGIAEPEVLSHSTSAPQ
jgi:hypothetical protein